MKRNRTLLGWRRRSTRGALVLTASALTGCYATVDPQPVGYVETTAAPVDIETYPSVVYLGHPVYFNGDRWWYRDDGGRWTYYRSEPEELRRQRDVVLPRVRARVRAVPRGELREEHREEHHEERHEERR